MPRGAPSGYKQPNKVSTLTGPDQVPPTGRPPERFGGPATGALTPRAMYVTANKWLACGSAEAAPWSLPGAPTSICGVHDTTRIHDDICYTGLCWA